MFSTAGIIDAPTRSNLKPAVLEKLTLLNANRKLVEDSGLLSDWVRFGPVLPRPDGAFYSPITFRIRADFVLELGDNVEGDGEGDGVGGGQEPADPG